MTASTTSASDSTNYRGESNIVADYAAIRSGVGVIDLSQAAKLEISGENATQFLNGLVTNDVKSLATGQGCLAAFLNVSGKVLALCRIYRRKDSFLFELDVSNRDKVYRNLARFVPAGGFVVKDLTDEYALFSVQGPRSKELLTALTQDPIEPGDFAHSTHEIVETPVTVAQHSRSGAEGFDLFVSSEAAQAVFEPLVESAATYGGRVVSDRALDIARIEAGLPREPDDLNESHILLEAGLESAVSYTKGCYLGQEIIARIHWRGQPAKRLKRLIVEADAPPPIGAELFAEDGKRVGAITSSADVPALGDKTGAIVALAYVHRYYLAEGTRLTIMQDGATIGHATID